MLKFLERGKMTFPIEILEQIFVHIDPVTLTRLRTTCKLWKEIIDGILQDYNVWYKKCKEDIPTNICSLLFESLYPSRSYADFENGNKDIEIWMNIYKWWTKSKNLTKYNISMECLDPIPNYRCRENITCIAILENILAIGTSEGYIYFYEIYSLYNKLIYVADHMEFVCKVKFLKNDKKCIAVSSCINEHVKFWDFKSKELINKDRGKLLCTSHSYCYTALQNTLIVQGCVPRTLYEFPDDIVTGTADGNKIYFYTAEGYIVNGDLATDEDEFFTEFVEPPELFVRHYYMFKTKIAVCITEHGYLGFSIQGGQWKFHNILPIHHGVPTSVLIYAHLLILGLDSGHICIYHVENFETLDMTSATSKKEVLLDTEPIISLDISVHLKQYIIAASTKRVYFVHFI